MRVLARILCLWFTALSAFLSFTYPVAAEDSVAAQQLPIPVLDCTVEYADGFFDAYSAPPVKGNTTVLDLKKFMSAKRHEQLNFEPVNEPHSTNYIIVVCPLKLIKTNKTMDKKDFFACRLEGADSGGAFNKSRFDVRVSGKDRWIVYYMMDVDDVGAGVLVMSAKPHAIASKP